jgi:dihydroorotate dehydrogenase
VNIGKNRTTSNEDAAKDYVTCMREIGDLADAFVINISSPNTTGLRDLFKPQNFEPFLQEILRARNELASAPPLLLKLSPDLEDEDLENVVRAAVRLKLDGFIATNTTLARTPAMPYPKEGGVSGKPLAQQSKEVLKKLTSLLGADRVGKLIISVGGVMTPEDVMERLTLGADLVQVYTALIYEGPFFFSRVARHASENPS